MNSHNKNKFNLDDLKKENPFQVPENYFDSLGAKITNRIEASSRTERKHSFDFIPGRSVIVFAGGVAAVALIAYLGFSIFFTNIPQAKTSNADIANITEYSLVSELDEATLVETFGSKATEVTDSLHLENKENIIDYLVKEDIDIATIIDEL